MFFRSAPAAADADLAALQAELAALQEEAPTAAGASTGPAAVRVSERNAVEIVGKLVATRRLAVLHTLDGTQWVTPARLAGDVLSALSARGGRATLSALSDDVGVDVVHVAHAVRSSAGGGGPAARPARVFIIQGADVVSSAYLDTVADAAAETLATAGAVSVGAIAEQHMLPVDVVTALIAARLRSADGGGGSAAAGSATGAAALAGDVPGTSALAALGATLRGHILVSPAFARRQQRIARAATVATTLPTPLARVAAALAAGAPPLAVAADPRFLEAGVRAALDGGGGGGSGAPVATLRGDTLVPVLFASAQRDAAASYLAANGTLPLSRAERLGFPDARSLLAHLRRGATGRAAASATTSSGGGDDVVLLSTCIAAPAALLAAPLAEVEDAVANASWLHVPTLLPAELSPADVRMLLGLAAAAVSGGDDESTAPSLGTKRGAAADGAGTGPRALPAASPGGASWLPHWLVVADLDAAAAAVAATATAGAAAAAAAAPGARGRATTAAASAAPVAPVSLSRDSHYLVSSGLLVAAWSAVAAAAAAALSERVAAAEAAVAAATDAPHGATDDGDGGGGAADAAAAGRAARARARGVLRGLTIEAPTRAQLAALVRAAAAAGRLKQPAVSPAGSSAGGGTPYNPQGETLGDHPKCVTCIADALAQPAASAFAAASSQLGNAVSSLLASLATAADAAAPLRAAAAGAEGSGGLRDAGGVAVDADDEAADGNDTARPGSALVSPSAAGDLLIVRLPPLPARRRAAAAALANFYLAVLAADAAARGIASFQVAAPDLAGWPTLSGMAAAAAAGAGADDVAAAVSGSGAPRVDPNDAALSALCAAALTGPCAAAAGAAVLWTALAALPPDVTEVRCGAEPPRRAGAAGRGAPPLPDAPPAATAASFAAAFAELLALPPDAPPGASARRAAADGAGVSDEGPPGADTAAVASVALPWDRPPFPAAQLRAAAASVAAALPLAAAAAGARDGDGQGDGGGGSRGSKRSGGGGKRRGVEVSAASDARGGGGDDVTMAAAPAAAAAALESLAALAAAGASPRGAPAADDDDGAGGGAADGTSALATRVDAVRVAAAAWAAAAGLPPPGADRKAERAVAHKLRTGALAAARALSAAHVGTRADAASVWAGPAPLAAAAVALAAGAAAQERSKTPLLLPVPGAPAWGATGGAHRWLAASLLLRAAPALAAGAGAHAAGARVVAWLGGGGSGEALDDDDADAVAAVLAALEAARRPGAA